jgi:hypothetical protein
MMPSAHPITMISPAATKPKIGFSIDSIVGGDRLKPSNADEDSNDASHENLPKLPDDLRREYSHLMRRARQELTPSPDNIEVDDRATRLSECSDQDFQNNNRATKSARSPSPSSPKAPIIVPGIPASLMNRPPMHPHHPSHQLPTYHDLPPGHPHFLQFQAAAALVHAQAAQTGFSNGLPHHLPHLHNPNMPRDSYPLYPWLLSRHGRIFPHRFPGSE